MQWKFEYLGGYECMRDGTQTYTARSHKKALSYIDEDECFYEVSKQDLDESINKLTTDAEAFTFLEGVWATRHNDGGGWGRVSCNDITNLLLELQKFQFETTT